MLARFALFTQHSRQHVDQHVRGTANRAKMQMLANIFEHVQKCWPTFFDAQHVGATCCVQRKPY